MTTIDEAIAATIAAARRVKRTVADMNAWCGDNYDVKYGVTEDVEALEGAIKALQDARDGKPQPRARKCCDGDCNQGRLCPIRVRYPED